MCLGVDYHCYKAFICLGVDYHSYKAIRYGFSLF